MGHLAGRRSIDWEVILPDEPPAVRLASPSTFFALVADLSSEVLANPSPDTAHRVLRHAVEFSRIVIGLERCGIFVLDAKQRAMVGTWGTDSSGEIVDEHGLAFSFGGLDQEVFARAQAGYPWTVYENCPHIAQRDDETRIIGRGWVACTPIVGPRGALGILFNDTAISHAPFDEGKQARVAVLCSLLGRALEPCRAHLAAGTAVRGDPPHPLVGHVTRLLVGDPTLSCEALAKELHMSAGRLARNFKRQTKTSVVDHRNELRLVRFLERVDARGHNLLEAALDAGFGSYAQFSRVFRARFGRAPREYLLERGVSASPGDGRGG